MTRSDLAVITDATKRITELEAEAAGLMERWMRAEAKLAARISSGDEAWRRGLYPEPGEPERFGQTVPVTIKLESGLYAWLQGFVGRNSFTFCVEEAITTALRVMRGDLDVSTLLHVMASNNGISPVEAMLGPMPEERRAESWILLQAAAFAAQFDRSSVSAVHALDDMPEDARGRLLKAWQAVSGRDVAADVEAQRAEILKANQAAGLDEIEADGETRWERDGDLNDGIPF